jgi:hypothetical protein
MQREAWSPTTRKDRHSILDSNQPNHRSHTQQKMMSAVTVFFFVPASSARCRGCGWDTAADAINSHILKANISWADRNRQTYKGIVGISGILHVGPRRFFARRVRSTATQHFYRKKAVASFHHKTPPGARKFSDRPDAILGFIASGGCPSPRTAHQVEETKRPIQSSKGDHNGGKELPMDDPSSWGAVGSCFIFLRLHCVARWNQSFCLSSE